jgi:hypothetical protein
MTGCAARRVDRNVARAEEGTQGRERMTRHRTIVLTLALVAAVAVLPTSALASSLLSGYGAPGSGDQAILGSALLNGPRGGGNGGAGVRGAGAGVSASTRQVQRGPGATIGTRAGLQGSPSSAVSAHRHRSSRAAVNTSGSASTASRRSARRAQQSIQSSFTYPTSSLPGTENSGTLGFSGEDLLLLVLAIGALACTGAFTRQLARTNQQPRI